MRCGDLLFLVIRFLRPVANKVISSPMFFVEVYLQFACHSRRYPVCTGPECLLTGELVWSSKPFLTTQLQFFFFIQKDSLFQFFFSKFLAEKAARRPKFETEWQNQYTDQGVSEEWSMSGVSVIFHGSSSVLCDFKATCPNNVKQLVSVLEKELSVLQL